MLAKLIENHVDEMDVLEEELGNEADALIKKIDVDALMADPEGELLVFVDALTKLIEDKYIERAVDKGVDFGEKIQKMAEEDKKIKVELSKDPNRNQGELNV